MAHKALLDYIAAARKKGRDDARIQQDLLDAGWSEPSVAAALHPTGDDLPVPPPPPGEANGPRPVVHTFSTRGLEYIIMFIAMGVAAVALGSLLHSSINNLFGTVMNQPSGGNVPIAASALIVAFPIWGYLFLRLKRAEAADPELRFDPSRKRAIQLTLVVTFLVGLGNVIYFVYSLLSGGINNAGYDGYNSFGSPASAGLLGNFVHLVVTLAIAGGIFYYYWRDQHERD